MQKKIVMSGIKPTNELHIGNLFGCINLYKNFSNDQYDIYFFIPDLHALTTNKHIYKSHIYNIIRYYLILLPNHKIHFYIQSNHKYVTKLTWILNCITPIGELNRMTQFKDKQQQNMVINAGLLIYPVLMAADILSINANIVPVGEDQVQHLELTRNISERFNKLYETNLFTIPNAYVMEEKRIYNILDTEIKMSKSNGNTNGVIFLHDDKQTIIRKIRKATTDMLPMPNTVDELQTRHNIENLINIYALTVGVSINDVVNKYKGQMISVFKNDLSEILSEYISNLHTKAMNISDDIITNLLNESYNKIENINQQQELLLNNIIFKE